MQQRRSPQLSFQALNVGCFQPTKASDLRIGRRQFNLGTRRECSLIALQSSWSERHRLCRVPCAVRDQYPIPSGNARNGALCYLDNDLRYSAVIQPRIFSPVSSSVHSTRAFRFLFSSSRTIMPESSRAITPAFGFGVLGHPVYNWPSRLSFLRKHGGRIDGRQDRSKARSGKFRRRPHECHGGQRQNTRGNRTPCIRFCEDLAIGVCWWGRLFIRVNRQCVFDLKHGDQIECGGGALDWGCLPGCGDSC